MRRLLAAVPLLLCAPLASAQHAARLAPMQDVRALAATCAACHGDGRSKGTGRPLRDLSQSTLRRALLDFRTGARPGTVMPQIARGYDDAEVDALAGWFAQRPSPR